MTQASASRQQATWGEKAALLVVEDIKQHDILKFLERLKKEILQITSLQSAIRMLQRPMSVETFDER
jgi:hypothetical protein